jgi:hypothetical protein
MSMGTRIADLSVRRHRSITVVMVVATLAIGVLAVVPTLAPSLQTVFAPITVDTDPENMLADDEPVRVFHNQMKERFELNDMVVIGVVNDEHPDGVFNPATLAKIKTLTDFAQTLHYDRGGYRIEPGRPGDADKPGPEGDGRDTGGDGPDLPAGLGGEGGDGPDLPAGLGDDENGPDLPPGLGGDDAGDEEDPREDRPEPIVEAEEYRGVISRDVIAPSAVDKVEPGDPVRVSLLMPTVPKDANAARRVRLLARRTPFLNGTLVSEDGKMVAIYLPLTHKDLSHTVYTDLKEKIDELGGPERFYITGLPVAEDHFGHEMFIQMAISAPAAMALIFVLMLVFFRKLIVVVSPMIVAMVSVIFTMGSLVISGFTIHIMSSMIPIFIMPIAVLDSIHIISEFFEKYQATRDRAKTIRDVMDALFVPMLYTSLTSAAGFASLALTPIPPVQVFGVFVALGIMVAWLLTVVFIPAFVMFIPPRALENFGARHDASAGEAHPGLIGRFLHWTGGWTVRYAKPILGGAAVVALVSVYGMGLIRVNDNPVKWFTESHPIRVADRVLNDHFGGTYMAYLSLEAQDRPIDAERLAFIETRAGQVGRKALDRDYPGADDVLAETARLARRTAREVPAEKPEAFFEAWIGKVRRRKADANDARRLAWDEALTFAEQQKQAFFEVFKDPQVLRYVADLQRALGETGVVGKSNSVADVVRTVHRDFRAEEVEFVEPENDPLYSVPDTQPTVADMLIQFQGGRKPHFLWHMVTRDYRSASLWVQLTSGDNQDMSAVVREIDAWLQDRPAPVPMKHAWFGKTFLNVKWQEKMVTGMLQSFAGSFLVVFLLMTILFRSALWGLLSMVPLTFTIGAIYGALGILGKDYDMPVAVLSSLTLGLAVDFAIHFLARSRAMYREHGSWAATAPAVFGEPARAIVRNIIVIATGFLPLLLAPLVPYQTVGMLMATILLVSGLATLLLLPALIGVLESRLFPSDEKVMHPACNCGSCVLSACAVVGLIVLNGYQLLSIPLTTLTWVAIVAVPAMALACGWLSRRQKCKTLPQGGAA